MKDRIKTFWSKHKNRIVFGGGVLGVFAGTFIVAKANLDATAAKRAAQKEDAKAQIKAHVNLLEVENRSLDRENEALYANNVLLNREVARLRDEVNHHIDEARMKS